MFHPWRANRCVAAASLLALAASACADWVVRPVATGATALSTNVEVMVRPDGEVVVGYTLAQGGLEGRVWLSKLSTGGAFVHQRGPTPATVAAFAMDPFGGVHYAARGDSTGPITIGMDIGEWGGIIEAPLPQGPHRGAPALAVDGRSIPSVAAADARGRPFVSWFDPVSATWTMETTAGDAQFPAEVVQALAQDGAGRLFLASTAEGTLSIASRSGPGQWEPLPAGPMQTALGFALAGSAEGTGFAWTDTAGLIFGTTDGRTMQSERIDDLPAVRLLPRSIAFDAAGNPAIACVVLVPGGPSLLHLLRREADGVWRHEPLPLEAHHASLAFDAAGNPLIAAATASGVILVGKMLPPLQRGDFTGSAFAVPDGVIDCLDIDAIVSRIGKDDLRYDLDGDGAVTAADADHLIRWILGSPLGDATLDGRIDGDDFFRIDRGFLLGLCGYANGDFDHDGAIAPSDYFRIDQAFLQAGPLAPAMVSVPEPAGMSLVLLLGLLGCCRRQVRRDGSHRCHCPAAAAGPLRTGRR